MLRKSAAIRFACAFSGAITFAFSRARRVTSRSLRTRSSGSSAMAGTSPSPPKALAPDVGPARASPAAGPRRGGATPSPIPATADEDLGDLDLLLDDRLDDPVFP